MVWVLEDQAGVKLNDEHQNDRPDRPLVLFEYLLDRAEAEQDVAPLGQDLNADVDEQDTIVDPQRNEDGEPVPVRPGLEAQAQKDEEHQYDEPRVQGTMDEAHPL